MTVGGGSGVSNASWCWWCSGAAEKSGKTGGNALAWILNPDFLLAGHLQWLGR